MDKRELKTGALQAGFSYILWGLLPIYWKILSDVSSEEILASRILWSFVFMLLILVVTKKWGQFLQTFKEVKRNQKQLWVLVIASLLISGNWFIYIWAVNDGQVIQASLGYYINPLISVLLGLLFLKEKLSAAQYLSFSMAAVGVLVLSFSYGQVPWISLALAFSFGFYGLVKKLMKVDSAIGLTLETMVVSPIALAYMVFLFVQDQQSFLAVSLTTDLLLFGAGAATAIPLLLFAMGAQKIPLSMLGFIQYIAPTIMLLLGVFIYDEHFSSIHLISFLFIWAALVVYSLSRTKIVTRIESRWRKEKRIGA